MFESLLRVEGYALGNGAEVTAELSKDIAKLIVAVCLLNHPQVDEAIERGGRERKKLLPFVLFIEASQPNTLYLIRSWAAAISIVYTEGTVSLRIPHRHTHDIVQNSSSYHSECTDT
jgi:hypothetical protein